MNPQRPSKAINDYPAKFDWPGIKGCGFCAILRLLFKCDFYSSVACMQCPEPAKPVKVVLHVYSESAMLQML